MDRFFFRALLLCLLGPAGNFASAQADAAPASADIVISSGLEGGGYWNAGSRLQTAASGMGLSVENRASIGSLTNLKKLLHKGSPVSLAFAQADALHYYLQDNPDAAQAIETLENIGQECVFIISDSEGDISTDQDMQDAPRLHLGIKSPNSGIKVTFDYMVSQMPELGNITIIYGDVVEMMNEFEHPQTNVDRAVMVVQAPNAHSPEIDMVIANPDRFRFVEISSESLTRKTASGEVVYESKKVRPGAVDGANAVKTICVQGLLLANKTKLTAAQRDTLAQLIENHWAEIRATDE